MVKSIWVKKSGLYRYPKLRYFTKHYPPLLFLSISFFIFHYTYTHWLRLFSYPRPFFAFLFLFTFWFGIFFLDVIETIRTINRELQMVPPDERPYEWNVDLEFLP